MKKLFVCAMALAAFVSCSKDEPTALETSKKSVSITIANAVSSTRAVDALTAEDVVMDTDGSVGKVLNAGQNVVSAEYTDLEFLFANKNGEIVEIHTPADAVVTSDNDDAEVHSLTFHRVTEAATQIAVVKYGDMDELKVGDNLAGIRDEAADESKNNEIVLEDITLYGASDIAWDGKSTCTVDGVNFNLYTAAVDVAPLFARVEISGIECSDLGDATFGMAINTIDPTVAVKGYDELTLNNITFGTHGKYTYAFAEGTKLLGRYNGDITTNGGTRPDFEDTRIYAFDATAKSTLADVATATNADGKYTANNAATMLAWNIAPQAAPSFTAATEDADEVISNPLVLSLSTHAYDFTNATKDSSVTVKSLGVEDFEAGNIYRLYLEFAESNIDNYNDGLCVNVEVTVAKWVVNIVNPTFKTN